MIAGIFLLLAAAGVYLMITKKYRTVGKGLVSACVCAAALAVWFFMTVLISMSSVHQRIYLPIMTVFMLLIAASLVCLIWGVIRKKRIYIPLAAGAAACVIAFTGAFTYYASHDAVPTVGEADDLLSRYTPYAQNSQVAALDEPSVLTIAQDLPVMDGATALYPVYAAFAQAVYPREALEDARRWDSAVRCSTTSGAYEAIVTGEADIIFCAAPSDKQKQFALDQGVKLVFTPIGREAFVFFVNSRNPLDDFSVAQIQAIYGGEVTQWADLGIKGLGRIRAFQRDEGSGSQSALMRLMNGKPLMKPPTEDVLYDMGGIITQAADYKNYQNAIGYSFRFYASEMVQNEQIKLLKINGVYPSEQSIRSGEYPIASSFYAVTRADAGENVQRLLMWILGAQGQALVEKTGYTPIADAE